MKKNLIILILFVLAQKSTVTVAQDNIQTYKIYSLNGIESKVKVWDHFEQGTIRITYLKDTINIHESTGIDKTVILNNNFIKISYRNRGGSDIAVGNVIVLCINNNRLYEALHALEYINWDVHGEKADYHFEALTYRKQQKKL